MKRVEDNEDVVCHGVTHQSKHHHANKYTSVQQLGTRGHFVKFKLLQLFDFFRIHSSRKKK
ncbi:UNVERIFIED_CONTAM: hypothetical protein FKN15_072764 [Acipenser sinensis]